PAKYECAGLTTGASAPYDGTVKTANGVETTDIPLPPDVSTEAGGIQGAYASLIKLDVTYKSITKKVHGKTVSMNAFNSCKGKSNWSFAFTALNYQGSSPSQETDTVKGSAK